MEDGIGIIICVCIGFLCLAEIALFFVSLYLNQKMTMILHIIGIIVSGLLCAFMITYTAYKTLLFNSPNVLLAAIIVGIIFLIIFSINSFFVNKSGIDFRIKQKREMIKKMQEEKTEKANDDEDKAKEEEVHNTEEKTEALDN